MAIGAPESRCERRAEVPREIHRAGVFPHPAEAGPVAGGSEVVVSVRDVGSSSFARTRARPVLGLHLSSIEYRARACVPVVYAQFVGAALVIRALVVLITKPAFSLEPADPRAGAHPLRAEVPR